MTDFQNILHLFDQFDIRNEAQLEKFMQESWEQYEYDWSTDEPSTFGGRLTVALSQLDLDASSSRESLGIQQYSLAKGKNVAADDVKKALFLSRRATIFTPHSFEIRDHHDDYAGGDEQIYRLEKTLSWDPELFRDIYKFRDAIERGQLRLLPSEFTSRNSTSKTTGEEEGEPRELIGVLEEINTSNALAMKRGKRANPDLIDRVLRSYRRKEQLVHLARLEVPWIQGISLEDVLRVKDDHQDALDRFQGAYHEAIAEQIKNYGSLDFQALSDQIRDDLIQPQLNALESKYKRTVARHRSLAVAGAAFAFVPLGIAVVSQQFFNSGFGDAGSMIPAGMTGAFSSLVANKINMKSSAGDMEENTFYVLWLLGRETD